MMSGRNAPSTVIDENYRMLLETIASEVNSEYAEMGAAASGRSPALSSAKEEVRRQLKHLMARVNTFGGSPSLGYLDGRGMCTLLNAMEKKPDMQTGIYGAVSARGSAVAVKVNRASVQEEEM